MGQIHPAHNRDFCVILPAKGDEKGRFLEAAHSSLFEALHRSLSLYAFLWIFLTVAIPLRANAFTIHPATWFPLMSTADSLDAGSTPNHELITLCGIYGVSAGACSTAQFPSLTAFDKAMILAVVAPDFNDLIPIGDVSAHHFDNSKISQGLSYIAQEKAAYSSAMAQLNNTPAGLVSKQAFVDVGTVAMNVIQHLGNILHAAEDFYSHTNYVEIQTLLLGNANPGLWDWTTMSYSSGVGASAVTVSLGSGRFPDNLSSSGVPIFTSSVFTSGVISPQSAVTSLPAIAAFVTPASGVPTPPSHEVVSKDKADSIEGQLTVNGESLFEYAKALAIAEAARQMSDFLTTVVSDPVSGTDLFDYWNNNPEFIGLVDNFLPTFDGSPESWARFTKLGTLEVPVPEPKTPYLIGLSFLLIIWFRARIRLFGRLSTFRRSVRI